MVIARRQPDGNIVFGTFLVDYYCSGLKNTYRNADVPPGQFRRGHLPKTFAPGQPTNISPALAHEIIYGGIEYAAQFDMGLEWVSPSAAMMRRAAVIAREAGATVYDATFAALAESLEATFVTADEHLARRLAPWSFVRFLGDAGNNREHDDSAPHSLPKRSPPKPSLQPCELFCAPGTVGTLPRPEPPFWAPRPHRLALAGPPPINLFPARPHRSTRNSLKH